MSGNEVAGRHSCGRTDSLRVGRSVGGRRRFFKGHEIDARVQCSGFSTCIWNSDGASEPFGNSERTFLV